MNKTGSSLFSGSIGNRGDVALWLSRKYKNYNNHINNKKKGDKKRQDLAARLYECSLTYH